MKISPNKKLISKKNIGILLLIAVVGLILITNIGGKPKEQAPLAEKPKECLELRGTGKQTYNVKTDKPTGFEIVQVDVDPIDVKEGEMQTITVKVKDDGNSTITEKSGVTAIIQTDNKNIAAAAFVMRLAEDSEDGSSLLTTWEGSWIKDDTTCYAYMETIIATNDKGDETFIDLSFK